MKEEFENFKKFWTAAMPIQSDVDTNIILKMKEELSQQLKSNIVWVCYRNNTGEHEVIRATHLKEHKPRLQNINTPHQDSIGKLFDIDDEKEKTFNWGKLVTYQIGINNANI